MRRSHKKYNFHVQKKQNKQCLSTEFHMQVNVCCMPAYFFSSLYAKLTFLITGTATHLFLDCVVDEKFNMEHHGDCSTNICAFVKGDERHQRYESIC